MSNTLDTVILTNECTCMDGEEIASSCYGDCYDQTLDILSMVLKNWREMNSHKASDEVRIDGEKMTWQRLSGHAVVDVSDDLTEALVSALRINGDWTLVFKVSHEGHLSVVRYSHDEPTGAGFSIGFVPEEVSFVS